MKTRHLASITLAMTVALVLGSCTMSKPTLRWAIKGTYDPAAGKYAELGNYAFGKKAMRTAMIRPDRFKQTVGFGIFLTSEHRPDRVPVLLVHGHGSGPRGYKYVGPHLDARLEPWYAFYPSGARIDESAAMLRESLARACEEMGVARVLVIGHSQGGLVTRKALDDADDGVVMPEVTALVGISAPWGGSETASFGADTALALPAWHDMAVGSEFLETLFDHPLPFTTRFHIFYGLAGDNEQIPGEDDGTISEASLTRKEALDEATTVNRYEHVGHSSIMFDAEVMERLNEILVESIP